MRWALALGLFGILFFFTVPDVPYFRLCGFYWLTGHPCALCGMTRAMFALAKGHLGEAVRFHALAPLGFAMVFAVLGDVKISGRMWTVVLATFAVYGVCRVFVTQ
jgi:hypothetical protein